MNGMNEDTKKSWKTVAVAVVLSGTGATTIQTLYPLRSDAFTGTEGKQLVYRISVNEAMIREHEGRLDRCFTLIANLPPDELIKDVTRLEARQQWLIEQYRHKLREQ